MTKTSSDLTKVTEGLWQRMGLQPLFHALAPTLTFLTLEFFILINKKAKCQLWPQFSKALKYMFTSHCL